jgi:hypothetical protein
MALIDYIASTGRDGGVATKAYYRGMQERRAQETHGLQQMQREQTIQQNEFKLASQQRQVEQQQRQQEIIKNYKGDKRGLIDEFMKEGDLEAAGRTAEFATQYDKMTTAQQKEVDRRTTAFNEDSIASSDSVLQEFQKGPDSGMQAYADEYGKLTQQYPKLSEIMPDPNVASPDQVLAFNRLRRNRSLKHQKFDELKRHQKAMEDAAMVRANKRSAGTAEFERLEEKVQAGTASPSEKHRHAVLSGEMGRAPTKGTESRFEKRLSTKLAKEKRADTDKLTKSADDKIAPFTEISNNIDKAIAAMDSGDTSISDRMVTQVIAQITNPNVRAFQMYKEFNTSFGNAIQRVTNSVQTWATGKRTPEEKTAIRDTLLKFKQDYSDPGIKYMSKKFRASAVEKGLRPWEVVPPRNLQEIFNATDIDDERKVDLWQKYFPDESP